MDREALIESLIQQIYEAAVGAIGWIDFVGALAKAFESDSPSIYFADAESRDSEIAFSVGMDDKLMRAYKEYYAERNIWLNSARPHLLRPGVVRSSHNMCSRQEFLRSEWYADFCKQLNLTQGLGATILKDGTRTSNIGVFADSRRRPYDEEDFALMAALMPHLQRALRMHMHLSTSQARGQALENVLNGLSTAVLLVTAEGRILFMNPAAERLIRASDGLRVEKGELHALLSAETKPLRTLIAEAALISCGPHRNSGGVVRISRPYGHAPLEALVSPLVSRSDDWLVKQPAVAAIFVSDRSHTVLADGPALVQLYGLTRTEANVTLAVSRGLAGKETCRELNISYNTLKTHLKRIYAKTRTTHQSDLVRLVVGALPAKPASNARDEG